MFGQPWYDTLPCLFELDENGEATGVVALYCSQDCLTKDSPGFERFEQGKSHINDICSGAECWHCGEPFEVANCPCKNCGREDLPLHYNRLCPDCFKE